jgi:hypothetical protein
VARRFFRDVECPLEDCDRFVWPIRIDAVVVAQG